MRPGGALRRVHGVRNHFAARGGAAFSPPASHLFILTHHGAGLALRRDYSGNPYNLLGIYRHETKKGVGMS